MKSKLIEQLEALPSFNAFKKAVSEKLTIDNYYVKSVTPEREQYDEAGEGVYRLTYDEIEDIAIDNILEDATGYFDEFVVCELDHDMIELVRAIIKEMRK